VAVYLLALGAAMLFGLGSVVQQRVASDAPPGKTLKISLLLWLVRRPSWLAGVGAGAVGTVLSGTALSTGSVALVQPLLVTGLLFALPLSAAWRRQRLAGRDWLGALATAGGLAAFVAAGRPEPGTQVPPPQWHWLVTIAAIAALTGGLLFALPLSAAWRRQRLAGRDWLGALATAGGLGAFIVAGRPEPGTQVPPPQWHWLVTIAAIAALTGGLLVLGRQLGPVRRAPLLGAGAGMIFGLQGGFTQTTAHLAAGAGISSVLLHWPAYAVAVTALSGTLLAQSAYEMAPLAASLPALSAIQPITGIGVGVGVLGGEIVLDALPFGIEMAGLAVMTGGIWLLATSPLVTGEVDLLEQRHEEGLAYQTEQRLRHDLDLLQQDLDALEEHLRPDRRRQRTLEHVCEDLDRVEAQLTRLTDLQQDIGRRRLLVQQRAAARPPKERAELARRERVLDEWEERISAGELTLRGRADEMRTRAEALRATR
jgi:drug/metabolite transporter (DMT)-like permease